MTLAPEHSRNRHGRYPPIDGFWTWDIKRDLVYGDANLSDYFGLTLDEFSHGASLERCMQSIDQDDRSRVRLAIREAVERKSSFRQIYRVRSEKMGLRKILAVGQCFVDGLGEAALYPGWFVDLTYDAACEEQALREIHNHVGQAKDIARSIGHHLISYLLDNIEEEVEQRLDRKLRRRRSS
ncbi:PAS domain-containing protein [Mesorhizobium sp. WSM4935]|uniref:PAS domain-containing protein n=1 Tax=Mesorhizobium sp. WSM4935 TaxID=3038547 RepID=UPI0024150B14|nr:PAS domain-containing protein [Mesorhizobium sp. WSM4935]MDG4877610.1 PAS domain-containing protein [Mesorhizobium sp. WSM4935]